MISHDEVQAALSARIDGERPLIDDAVVDAHLAQCPDCQRFWERSLALNQSLNLADADAAMAPPDLSDVILAGVSDQWHKLEQRRMVTLAIGRVGLVAMALVWAAWAIVPVASAGEPDPASLSFASVRFGVSLALGLSAWKPSQVPGVLLVVGTMFTFTAGFAVRDALLGLGEISPGLVVVPLLTSLALVWTWAADRGIEVRRAWALLNADPK